jgi:hypothetical protein
MSRAVSLFLICLAVVVTACSSSPSTKQQVSVKEEAKETRIPFTEALVQEFNIDKDGFCALQYYIAGDLTLVRTVSSEDDRKAKNGKLVRKDGKIEEFVEIKKGTPGICKGVQGNSKGSRGTVLEISFEEGTMLQFTLESDNYVAKTSSSGGNTVIDFQGARYVVKPDQVQAAFLRIEREDLKNYEARKKVLTGVKIGETPKAVPKDSKP